MRKNAYSVLECPENLETGRDYPPSRVLLFFASHHFFSSLITMPRGKTFTGKQNTEMRALHADGMSYGAIADRPMFPTDKGTVLRIVNTRTHWAKPSKHDDDEGFETRCKQDRKNTIVTRCRFRVFAMTKIRFAVACRPV